MAILEVLWGRGPSTAREVHEQLQESREIAYSTVLTVLRRLEERGQLTREKVSRSHVYQAAVAATDLRRRSLTDLVSRFFGSPGELVLHLLKKSG